MVFHAKISKIRCPPGLARTGNESIATLMRRLLTCYAVYFNHRHKRSGQLFQNRYKSTLCQEDAY